MASIPNFSSGVALRALRRGVLASDLLALWDGSQWLYGTFGSFGFAPGGLSAQIEATEALNAGALVNIWASGVRNANATTNAKPAQGYVIDAAASGSSPTVYFGGLIDGFVGLTPGATYFLATTNGLATVTAPNVAGNIDQVVGLAVSATTLLFRPQAALEV